MDEHSIAETRNRLSELVERAENGENVVITRHGHPVAKIVGIKHAARVVTDADLDWIAKRRVGRGTPKEDAGTFVSRMRDEDWR